MSTVRPEPFDFAQESPVEACPEPVEWGLCFDRLSTNEINYLPFVPSLSREACRRTYSGLP